MIDKKIELTPSSIDKRKSFYGKARVIIENGEKKLFSYETCVCKILKTGEYWITNDPDDLSQTTLRHIREFLHQYGGLSTEEVKALTKAKIIAMA